MFGYKFLLLFIFLLCFSIQPLLAEGRCPDASSADLRAQIDNTYGIDDWPPIILVSNYCKLTEGGSFCEDNGCDLYGGGCWTLSDYVNSNPIEINVDLITVDPCFCLVPGYGLL